MVRCLGLAPWQSLRSLGLARVLGAFGRGSNRGRDSDAQDRPPDEMRAGRNGISLRSNRDGLPERTVRISDCRALFALHGACATSQRWPRFRFVYRVLDWRSVVA